MLLQYLCRPAQWPYVHQSAAGISVALPEQAGIAVHLAHSVAYKALCAAKLFVGNS
jgi:hypothetical protein